MAQLVGLDTFRPDRLLVDKQIHSHRQDVRIGTPQTRLWLPRRRQTAGARTTPTPRPIESRRGSGDAIRREEDAKNKTEVPKCRQGNVKLKAPGLNDPQLHRPQQQVSILESLVEEAASMIVTRRCRKQHETRPGLAQTSASLQSRLNHIVKLISSMNKVSTHRSDFQ